MDRFHDNISRLKQHPSKWTIYVVNRVSEVQTSSLNVTWHHISSKENPTDRASRGLSASIIWRALTKGGRSIIKRDPAMLIDDYERNFHRNSKDYRISCGLYKRVGIAPTIFELDSASPSNSLCS